MDRTGRPNPIYLAGSSSFVRSSPATSSFATRPVTVTLNNFTGGATAKVYQSVNGAAPAAAANVAISAGAISSLSVAANSITLLVVGQ